MNSLKTKNQLIIALKSLFFAATLFTARSTFASEKAMITSEPSWTLKKSDKPKNWLQTKIDSFSQKMISRHSYKYKSFEHVRDMTILHLLPASLSQGILFKQRENMKNFLIKNEESALEGVREYWGFDQKEWSTIMAQAKKEHEFNLSEMRKDQNFSTHHDPSLPPQLVSAIKNECERHKINFNSVNFGTIRKEDPIILNEPRTVAYHQSFKPSWGILWSNYNPALINFDINDTSLFHHEPTLKDICTHEFTHIIQGHANQLQLILDKAKDKHFFYFFSHQSKFMDEYKTSSAQIALVAAIEKTADTLVACTDPEAAKNAIRSKASYLANRNDRLVINTNWETSQRIKNSRNILQSLKKQIHQATSINLF